MTKKLICTITGNWSYCSDERYQKLCAEAGGKANFIATYQSREGQKLVKQAGGDIEKAKKASTKQIPKGKVRCIVTGELCVISDERMAKLAGERGGEDKVHETYISRVANRLRKQLALTHQKDIDEPKPFEELTKKLQAEIDKEIRTMAESGSLPAPAAPKGSKQEAPKAEAKAKAPKAKAKASKRTKKDKPATAVKDTVPPESATPAEETVAPPAETAIEG